MGSRVFVPSLNLKGLKYLKVKISNEWEKAYLKSPTNEENTWSKTQIRIAVHLDWCLRYSQMVDDKGDVLKQAKYKPKHSVSYTSP